MSKTGNGNNKELSNNNNDDNSNSITTYSLGSQEDVEKVFKRFDINGDGMISITEFSDVLRALGSTPSADELKRIMTELDTDGDGFIDFKEFANFHRGGSDEGEEVTNRELRDAFDLYDRDKNGVISARELHAVLKSLGDKCSLKDCSRMISSFDVDGDGCVNFEEFKNMMKPKPKPKPKPIVD